MDVGGTMDPHVRPVSELLTALHEERSLRDLCAYYFHNCVYDQVYASARMMRADAVPTADVLRRLDGRWKVLLVGDAAMHPAELLEPYGGIDSRVASATPGIVWLHRIAAHFERAAWLNPEDVSDWDAYHTTRAIRRLFPMHPLTVDGLTDAVKALVGGRPPVVP
jgi:uncharacterized protein with von Willebrand factor type A (vWA) domain